MARSVADLNLAMSILADGWTSAAASKAGPGMRIGWAADFLQPSGREVRAVVESVAERAAASGMELVPLDARAVELAARTGELFGPLASIDPAAPESAELLRQREYLAEQVDELLARVDAWLLPVLPVPAPPHVETSAPIDVDGEQRDYWQVFTANLFPFNVTGHPATSLPVGLARSGLPVGIQLVGRRRSDGRLLSVAAALEVVAQFDSHPNSSSRGWMGCNPAWLTQAQTSIDSAAASRRYAAPIPGP
jgi:amidase